MERVLLETGVGGVVALHNYYQEYVLKFEENMKRKVERLMEEQRQLELTVNSTKYLLNIQSFYYKCNLIFSIIYLCIFDLQYGIGRNN